MALLPETEIDQRLSALPEWKHEGNAIVGTFEMLDFAEAMQLVNKVAIFAEDMNHHPDITIKYNIVTLTLSTHSEGGITEKDFELATKIKKIE